MQVRTQAEHWDITCGQSGRQVHFTIAPSALYKPEYRATLDIMRLSLSFPLGNSEKKAQNKVEIQIPSVNYTKARLKQQLILKYSQEYRIRKNSAIECLSGHCLLEHGMSVTCYWEMP
jgi:hypothetical protein